MKTVKAFVLLFIVLAVVGATLWALTKYVGLQGSLIWTAVFGGIAWLIKSDADKKREQAKLLADHKRSQYSQFLDFMLAHLGSSQSVPGAEAKSGLPPSAPIDADSTLTPAEKYRRWSLRLTLIGSDSVVRAWNNVRALGDGGLSDAETEEAKTARLISMMRAWGSLLIEMRRDCGHLDTKLTAADVFGTFVNDLEQYRTALEAPDSTEQKPSNAPRSER